MGNPCGLSDSGTVTTDSFHIDEKGRIIYKVTSHNVPNSVTSELSVPRKANRFAEMSPISTMGTAATNYGSDP